MKKMYFRAKDLISDDWVVGNSLKQTSSGVSIGYPDKNGEPIWIQVKPDTFCQAIEYHQIKNGLTTEEPIFDRDVVELEAFCGVISRYIIWYMEEGSEYVAIPWSQEDVDNKDIYFVGYPVNFKHEIKWGEFTLMLQDPYGDFKNITVIGNLEDNSEFCPKLEISSSEVTEF